MGRILAVFFTTILLFGCGGDDKKSEPPATMPETGATEGVVLNQNAALSISNSYLRVQVAPLPPVESTLESDCDGPSCTITESRTGVSETVSLQDIQNADTSTIEDLRQAAQLILTRGGVPVYGGSVTFSLGEDSTVSATALGGWMVHNFFLAAWGNYSDPNIPSADFGSGLSIGNAAGSHPDVDATYDGVMLGVITAEGGAQGNGVEGDATLDFRMANPGGARMDVSFTNITNRETDAALPDITWSGLQVQSDGTFDTGNIHGIFYGSAHEEVGGTFNKDNVAGAFGASR
ncbi:MAG: hypothetical protein OXL41_05185 [Nitrospinae bacterium]|nr:hypothetical protein [Nitrospinota bacterium]